ncbi:MAG: universal stress protein [Syntrophorhabdaceae bacterium]
MGDRNILVAFDGSATSLKTINYVGSQFSGLKDLKITLLYVVPNVPPQFWDDGHILTEAERKDRQAVIDRWFANQKMVMEPHFDRACKILTENCSFEPGQLKRVVITDVTDVADAILEEAKSGGYRTVIVGHKGGVGTIAGGLASEILHKAGGLAVCIVE